MSYWGTQMRSIVTSTFHDSMSIDHYTRLAKYREYWLYYLSKHWSYSRDPGDPTITINYSRRVVDIANNFTFKKGFIVKIPDDPSTPANEAEDREFVRVMLEETWEKNSRLLWLIEASQQGAVTGDLFARVSWENNDLLEEPYAKIDIIPSHLCFPEFGGPSGVERKKLKRIMILTPIYERCHLPQKPSFTFPHYGTNFDTAIMQEIWTAPDYHPDGSIKNYATVQYFRNNEPLGPPLINPIGEIPVVHIPNYPLSGESYGISDMVDIIELNRELNEKATDISDVISYHGSPVTILKGAKLKDLERGANKVWAIPGDGDVKNLELSGDLSASVNHWKMIKESLLELAGIPEEVLGKVQAASNASGVALAIRYMPLMEKYHIKTLIYGLGLRLINRLIMKITAIGDPAFGEKFNSLYQGNKYRNNVVFPDPMPMDEAVELEKARARLDLLLSTRREELEKMGKSQGEIEKIMQDIRNEAEEMNEMMFDMPKIERGKTQNMRGGVPEVRAQKVSNTAAKKTLSFSDE